ncbi:MAG: hypothetical protein ACTSPY_10370 [Candidatus Helarchaeota archaeon]
MAKSLKGVLKLVYPIKKGIISDWNALEKLLHKKFYSNLRVDPSSKDIGIIFPPMTSHDHLLKFIDIMFDIFLVRSLFLIPEPVSVSLYNGLLNSIVLHLGFSHSYFAKIKNGLFEKDSLTIFNFGLIDISNYFKRISNLDNQYSDTDFVIRLLLDYGHVSLDLENEEFENFDCTMPDGSVLRFNQEFYIAPEILFKPHLMGYDQKGISDALNDYISNNNISLPIILSGGCISISGLYSRLQNELNSNVIFPQDWLYQEWKGGSFLISKGYIKPLTSNDYRKLPDLNLSSFIPWF